jgi:hypothetical protein
VTFGSSRRVAKIGIALSRQAEAPTRSLEPVTLAEMKVAVAAAVMARHERVALLQNVVLGNAW